MQPGGQIRPHRPVTDLNDTAINRPGDGVAAFFYQGILVKFFGGGGGRIEVIICNRADKLDHTARSLTSTRWANMGGQKKEVS